MAAPAEKPKEGGDKSQADEDAELDALLDSESLYEN